MIGNQRQLEMKLNRQLGEIEKLQASARQALVLADRQRAAGDEAGAQRYEETAQVYASQLVTAEQSVEDLKTLHDQSLQAAGQAEGRRAQLGDAPAEDRRARKLLSQLEQAKMQEQAANSLRQMTQELSAPGSTPRWRMSATRSSGATRAIRRKPSSRRTPCRAACSVRGRRSTWPEPAGADPRLVARRPGRGRGHGKTSPPQRSPRRPRRRRTRTRPARCSSPARTDPARRGRRPPSRWAASASLARPTESGGRV